MNDMRIMPPLGANDVFESDAEKAVYLKLGRELGEDELALYSLWIRKTSSSKKHAEIDFLVATSKAFLILEVKGGLVWRDSLGIWHFRPRNGGQENTKREGPFDQARVALHAVESHLKRAGKSTLFHNYTWGYGVITPNCAFDVSRSDIGTDAELLLDIRKFDEPLHVFLEQLSDYWTKDCEERKRELGRNPQELVRSIGESKRKEVLELLRPAIHLIQSTGISMKEAIRRSDALTDEQAEVLDIGRDNSRVLLRGGAGSGKTLLAMEQAKRKCLEGNRVLFTCFNRKLAEHLAVTVADDVVGERLTIMNWHRIVRSLVETAGIAASIPEDWREFNKVAFDLAVESISEIDDFSYYDYLIVDEGQDLMSESFVDVLGLLLKDGIEGGNWLFCYDPHQAIYLANYEEKVLDHVCRFGVPLNLTKNCRNTRNVAAYVSGLSGTEPGSLMNMEGPKVDIEYFEDKGELLRQLKSIVNRSVTELVDAGLNVSDLTILSPRRDILENLAENDGVFIRPMQEYSVNSDPNKICWSTLHSFKGLESPEVVLVGFDAIKSDLEKLHLYVGGSRARSRLCLMLPESASAEVSNALPGIFDLLHKSS